MLKEEAKIYRHLPDEAAKQEFIEDFWLKRDPNPATEENEMRLEYEERLEFVERWFRESIGKGHGWESDRGKIYLLLGAPDDRTTHQANIIDRFGRPMRVLKEYWIYELYQLALIFTDADGFGVYRLEDWSPDLLAAIQRAKFAIMPEPAKLSNFRFKVKYKDGALHVEIPLNGVNFNEIDNQMTMAFKITVYIYRDYQRLDTLHTERLLKSEKETLLKQKEMLVAIPYKVEHTGVYVFDMIVEDVLAKNVYRDMCRYDLH